MSTSINMCNMFISISFMCVRRISRWLSPSLLLQDSVDSVSHARLMEGEEMRVERDARGRRVQRKREREEVSRDHVREHLKCLYVVGLAA